LRTPIPLALGPQRNYLLASEPSQQARLVKKFKRYAEKSWKFITRNALTPHHTNDQRRFFPMLNTQKGFMLIMTLWVVLGSFTEISHGQEIVLADFNIAQQVVPTGWELIINKGNADLRLTSEAYGQALQLRSKSASFALQKETHISLQDTPYLVWTWKVTQIPSGGDFRRRKTDDQASTVPKGVFGKAPSPPFRKIMAWVIQSGSRALGEWKTERRNLVDDYTQLFGEAPKALRGLRIQINSQHTQTHAEASWKSIILTNDLHTASRRGDHRLATRPIRRTLDIR
jgi:hypothetical protein